MIPTLLGMAATLGLQITPSKVPSAHAFELEDLHINFSKKASV